MFIGQEVEMVTRKLSQNGERGMLVYGYKFRPVFKPAPPDFSLRELTGLAQRSVADPKNEVLNAQYLKMFLVIPAKAGIYLYRFRVKARNDRFFPNF